MKYQGVCHGLNIHLEKDVYVCFPVVFFCMPCVCGNDCLSCNNNNYKAAQPSLLVTPAAVFTKCFCTVF